MGGGNGCRTPGFEGYVGVDTNKEENQEEVNKEEVGEENWDGFLQGVDAVQLYLQFDKIYGPAPKMGIFWGKRKFLDWMDKLAIFIEGAQAGQQNVETTITNSGWLNPEAQKMFEHNTQKRKEEVG